MPLTRLKRILIARRYKFKYMTMEEVEIIEVDQEIKDRYDCPVCDMDEWCGTDGCPMDPQ